MKLVNGPKVLLLDIETSPLLSYTWDIWDQNIALNQIQKEWNILSWSAKWLENPKTKEIYGPHNKVMYMDQRNEKNIENTSKLLNGIWELIDEADIILTQNGKKFDIKKLNAKFILAGMQPPSSFKQIDTLVIAKKFFAFTSNKLEWMTKKLCTKNKKLDHKKFPGFSLWVECIKGNERAWKEMEVYNKMDIISLQELFWKLIPWDSSINFNIYTTDTVNKCKCGNKSFIKKGFSYSAVGKYQRFRCKQCGAETKDRINLLTKAKKQSIRTGITR